MLLRVRQATCEKQGKEGEESKDTEDQARRIRFRFHVRFTYSFPFPFPGHHLLILINILKQKSIFFIDFEPGFFNRKPARKFVENQ